MQSRLCLWGGCSGTVHQGTCLGDITHAPFIGAGRTPHANFQIGKVVCARLTGARGEDKTYNLLFVAGYHHCQGPRDAIEGSG